MRNLYEGALDIYCNVVGGVFDFLIVKPIEAVLKWNYSLIDSEGSTKIKDQKVKGLERRIVRDL
tara:strand:+ start:605 stop:796 length:192 start_codon:yes stop_codon:yes gene_type:complete